MREQCEGQPDGGAAVERELLMGARDLRGDVRAVGNARVIGGVLHGGVVDQDREVGSALENFVGETREARGGGEIGGDGGEARMSGGELLKAGRIATGGENVGAGAVKRAGDFAADAGTGAGDEDAVLTEIHADGS